MNYSFFKTKSILALLMAFAVLATVAWSFSACSDQNNSGGEETSSQEQVQSDDTPNFGTEAYSFVLKVTKADGSVETFTVKTDCQNVGDAIVTAGIASGEKGSAGWDIFTVAGETHQNDGYGWAFYVDGMRAPKGVSQVMVNAASECFELRAEPFGD